MRTGIGANALARQQPADDEQERHLERADGGHRAHHDDPLDPTDALPLPDVRLPLAAHAAHADARARDWRPRAGDVATAREVVIGCCFSSERIRRKHQPLTPPGYPAGGDRVTSARRASATAVLDSSAWRATCSVVAANSACSRRRIALPTIPPNGPLKTTRSVIVVPASPGSITCSKVMRIPGARDSSTQTRYGMDARHRQRGRGKAPDLADDRAAFLELPLQAGGLDHHPHHSTARRPPTQPHTSLGR